MASSRIPASASTSTDEIAIMDYALIIPDTPPNAVLQTAVAAENTNRPATQILEYAKDWSNTVIKAEQVEESPGDQLVIDGCNYSVVGSLDFYSSNPGIVKPEPGLCPNNSFSANNLNVKQEPASPPSQRNEKKNVSNDGIFASSSSSQSSSQLKSFPEVIKYSDSDSDDGGAGSDEVPFDGDDLLFAHNSDDDDLLFAHKADSDDEDDNDDDYFDIDDDDDDEGVELSNKNSGDIDIDVVQSEIVPKHLSVLLEAQVIMKVKFKNETKWEPKDKETAIEICYQHPGVYNAMSTLFIFPSVPILRLWVERRVKPGICDFMFHGLALKGQGLLDLSNSCVLTFDTVRLPPGLSYNSKADVVEGLGLDGSRRSPVLANHVLVFMIQGLYKRYKQLVAYFPFHDFPDTQTLKKSLEDVITKLTISRFWVRGLTCQQNSSNRELFSKLGISDSKPYFDFQDGRIYGFFDTGNLLVSVRSTFQKHDFVLDGNSMSWDRIRQFHLSDNLKEYQYASKLTTEHLKPSAFNATKTEFATQLFSYKVAAGVSFGAKVAESTSAKYAQFILKLDELFDVTNCSNKSEDSINHEYQSNDKPHRLRLTDDSEHIKIMKEGSEIFRKLHFDNDESEIPFINSWLLTLRSISMLWEDLKFDGARSLATSKLNINALQKLIASVIQIGDPLLTHTIPAIKRNMAKGLLSEKNWNKCGSNGPMLRKAVKDFATHFCNANRKGQTARAKKKKTDVSPTVLFSFKEAVFEVNKLGADLLELEGYTLAFHVAKLMELVMPTHNSCSVCGDVIMNPVKSEEVSNSAKRIKTEDSKPATTYSRTAKASVRSDPKHLITLPSNTVIEFILQVEKVFVEKFNKRMGVRGLRTSILRVVSEIKCDTLCKIFKTNMSYAYVNMRLALAIKCINLKIVSQLEADASLEKQFGKPLNGLKVNNAMHLPC